MAAILIVDDDEMIRDALFELFEGEHLCHTAATADKALAYLREATYDLVLTDISMPGLSGVELLGHLRQGQPDTQVIIISAISDKAHSQTLIRMGAFDYLLKPFRLEEVETSVNCALKYRRQLLEERNRR